MNDHTIIRVKALDILVVERPSNWHVRGLAAFKMFDSRRELERFLLTDREVRESVECGGRLLLTSTDQPADVWPYEFEDDGRDRVERDYYHEWQDEG